MKAQTKVAHTPGPWDRQNKGNLYGPSARHEVVAGVAAGGGIYLPTICKMPDLSERSYANAAFIVRACNAHGELVTACQRLVDFWRSMVELGRVGWVNQDAPIAEGLFEDAKAALAKARGEP